MYIMWTDDKHKELFGFNFWNKYMHVKHTKYVWIIYMYY